MRYVRGYSWAKTGVRMNAPDSTVRNWHERAMERFGEALEEPAGGGGVGRPRRARAYIISAEKFCEGSRMILGLCLPPTGRISQGEPPETSPKGSFSNPTICAACSSFTNGERL